MIALWLVILASTNIRRSSIVLLLSVLLLLLPIAYLSLEGYQQERIDTYFSSTTADGASSYNVNQAIISIGNGGWLGTGLGSGSQSSLAFIPSSHTDFMFSVSAEKLGFIGGVIIITMLSLVVARIMWLAWAAKTSYVRYLGIGIASILGFQLFVNVGMNLGLVPVTGLPLPFVSYGGTHIVVSLAMLGVFMGAYSRGDT
jgi:rod shape determining protein RodA